MESRHDKIAFLKAMIKGKANPEEIPIKTEIWYNLEGTEYVNGDLKLTPAEFKDYQGSRRQPVKYICFVKQEGNEDISSINPQ
jgi:hypothetical protein